MRRPCISNNISVRSVQKMLQYHPDFAAFCWTRLFNIFGPHENKNRLIPYIFLSYFKKELPTLKNPHVKRDYLYIDEVAKILVALLELKTEQAINIGSNTEFSIAEITQLVHDHYFNDLPLPTYPTPLNPKSDRFLPDLNRLKKLEIKFEPSLIVGLNKMYDWLMYDWLV